MHPKLKNRPAPGGKTVVRAVKPLLLHDVANQAASANDASRHPSRAVQSASGTANHARHHVSRHTQA